MAISPKTTGDPTSEKGPSSQKKGLFWQPKTSRKLAEARSKAGGVQGAQGKKEAGKGSAPVSGFGLGGGLLGSKQSTFQIE